MTVPPKPLKSPAWPMSSEPPADRPVPPPAGSLDEAAAVFTGPRPRLFGITYRVLGDAADAEDVLRYVWVRRRKTDRSTAASPVAFLSLATTRPALDATRSARFRREHPLVPGLPDSMAAATATAADRAAGACRHGRTPPAPGGLRRGATSPL
ncbi:sigma factor [Streptomyces sp. NPDC048717]|uniref:sigma factor n=1 Tax=Streptomyces sp. NPDC048717 TaxID=3154928 RepID=UPI003440C31E